MYSICIFLFFHFRWGDGLSHSPLDTRLPIFLCVPYIFDWLNRNIRYDRNTLTLVSGLSFHIRYFRIQFAFKQDYTFFFIDQTLSDYLQFPILAVSITPNECTLNKTVYNDIHIAKTKWLYPVYFHNRIAKLYNKKNKDEANYERKTHIEKQT